MNIYISAKISNEKQYLHNMYPVDWAPFISGAMKFTSIEEARLAMNCLYKNLFYYPDFSVESFYSISFIGIENGVIVFEKPYVVKEV